MTAVYRSGIRTAGAITIACLLAGCRETAAPDASGQRWAETRRLMGVAWTITVCSPDPASAGAAITAACAEVERLERVFSDYDPESELSRLSARAPMAEATPVSDDLWRVLVRAAEIRDATAGAFDVSIGSLTTLWRQARRSGRLPARATLDAARAAVGPGAVELDHDRRAVRLPQPGSRLDLGGIGMGYAADRALEVLARHRISAAMIDASGDVVVSGPPPGTPGWRIALDPLGTGNGGRGPLVLSHAAVTTSGDAEQAVEIDGRRYSHIVDPRTGLGVAGPAAVTVIAPDGATADALATAASVLGPEAGRAVIERFPGAAALFTWQDGQGRRRESSTSDWPSR